jgi:hypothetical protein
MLLQGFRKELFRPKCSPNAGSAGGCIDRIIQRERRTNVFG